MNETTFLYEILEDYKDAETPEEKERIFASFCASVWSSANKRRIYRKTIRFHVPKNLLSTELGQIFAAWSKVEYKHDKSITKEDDWRAILRQKINNLYTRYFDKEVILFLDLLHHTVVKVTTSFHLLSALHSIYCCIFCLFQKRFYLMD